MLLVALFGMIIQIAPTIAPMVPDADSVNGPLIMLVEDNLIIQEMYQFKLRLDGFRVLPFIQGQKAIDYLREGNDPPDLILLDVMMPEMNGYQVLEMLRNEFAYKGKIVVFSNLNEVKDYQEAMRLGADEFVLKASLTPKELVSKIRFLL